MRPVSVRTPSCLGVGALWLALLLPATTGCRDADSAPREAAEHGADRRALSTARADGPGLSSRGEARFTEWDFSADTLRIQMRAVPAAEGDAGAPLPRESEAATTALASPAAQSLLARLGPMRSEPPAPDSLFLPVVTPPPPRTGAVVNDTLLAFGPGTGAARPPAPFGEAAGLRVTRYAPEGPVEIAGGLMVTFSQPMVALSENASVPRQAVPVRLEPEPEGTWRWVGTRTLAFEPIPRFPMATVYQVTVPAGMRSAQGQTLPQDRTWSFATPPPGLVDYWPREGPQRPDVPVLLAFNQRVAPEDVLAHVRITAGGRPFEPRLLNRAEAIDLVGRAEARAVERWMERFPAQRLVALRAARPLPKDTAIEVRLTPGLASAEGPLPSTQEQRFEFLTYAALAVVKRICRGGTCTPTSRLPIAFNNPLNHEGVDLTEWIRVDPPIEDFQVGVRHDGLYVRGRFVPHSTICVTVSKNVRDVFGQTLGEDVSIDFEVGAYWPHLHWDAHQHAVLDPAAPVAVPVYTTGHREIELTCRAVEPADWSAYREWRRRGGLPGRIVHEKVIEVPFYEDDYGVLLIDLEPAFAQAQGHLIVHLETGRQDGTYPSKMTAWFQKTDIGLSVEADDQSLLVWATDLLTGEPIEDAAVFFRDEREAVLTDATGLARLPLASSQSYLTARKGNRRAMLPANRDWKPAEYDGRLLWYAVDDRRLYRPGERLHMKGWLRLRPSGPEGDVTALGDRVSRIRYTAATEQGQEIASGEAPIDAHGGFALTFEVPDQVSLGSAFVELEAITDLSLPYPNHRHRFRIEEFRRPDYELRITRSDESLLRGSKMQVEVCAQYYTGGALAGAGITWDLHAMGSSYRPPGHAEFGFGIGSFYWFGGHGDLSGIRVAPVRRRLVAATNSAGRGAVEIDAPAGPPRPVRVRVAAVVQDLNQQALAADAGFLIHPAGEYVGIRREPETLAWGDSLRLAVRVCSIDGRPIAGRAVALSAEHLIQRLRDGDPVLEVDTRFDTTLVATDSVAVWSFKPELSGRWRLRALIRDPQGRENLTEVTRWVRGGSFPDRADARIPDKMALIPDRAQYSPGDTARVCVNVPFAPSELLVTLQRQGILETRRLSLASHEVTLDVPIEEVHLPVLHVAVNAVGSGPRDAAAPELPRKPVAAQGAVSLPVGWEHRRLRVNVLPAREAWAPGDSGHVSVRVCDHLGRPVPGAHVLLFAVDEAVLFLGRYHFHDPGSSFYRRVPAGVRSQHLRRSVLVWPAAALDPSRYKLHGSLLRGSGAYVRGGRGGEFLMRGDGIPPQSDGVTGSALVTDFVEMTIESASDASAAYAAEDGPRILSPLAIRSDFNPLAFFAASLVSDDAGAAEVGFRLPDNLTRYRVMAAATDGAQRFGAAESTFTGRKRLMVRPSLPRFLHAGDRCELPVQLHNLTETPLTARVAARADHLTLSGPAGYRVTIPAGDRVEVFFPAQAGQIGNAALEVVAVSEETVEEDRLHDATRATIPVRAPVTTEAFATYGTIADEPAVFYRTGLPRDAFTTYGGLELSTSSTALQALTDGLLYLCRYRYRSSEHLASRILAVASLRDVLTAFAAEELPSPEQVEQLARQDIAELLSRCDRGAFGMWRAKDGKWPFASVHATHALVLARRSGFGVTESDLREPLAHLKRLDRFIPKTYPEAVQRGLLAYALYVRHLAGDTRSSDARRLIFEAGGIAHLPLEAVGWLLPILQEGPIETAALVKECHRHLLNRSIESAGTAQFITRYEEGDHLIFHGRRRTDAVLLIGLMATDPDHELIVKLVRGLLGHRTRGHWSTTQENAWVLVALGDYFRRYEAQEPDFLARAWLGEQQLAETVFRGRQTERRHLVIPMARLREQIEATGDSTGLTELVLEKSGAGRLYYRVGMRYAPRDPDLPAIGHGFTVTRTYRGADRAEDVWHDAAGNVCVRAGTRVEVEVTMVAPARRYHVALVDPLPAGFEILNPSLAGYGRPPGEPIRRGWFGHRWFEHQSLRDEQAEAFTSLLNEGVYSYVYTVRATTPGRFIAPPPRAEEMYQPETFGRGKRDVVIVQR